LGTIILLIIAGLVILNSSYSSAINNPNSTSNKTIEIIIEPSDSLDQITNKLVENGLLSDSNKLFFRYYLKKDNLYSKFQVGQFRIPQNLTIVELAETLQHAGIPDFWVTLPEGLRKDEVANKISLALTEKVDAKFNSEEFIKLTTDQEFIKTLELPIQVTDLEGLLFPDKYLMDKNVTAKDAIKILTDNYKKKAPIGMTYEQLKIASYLEREGSGAEDRKMIADVINKRLNEGWLLNIDATLVYPRKDWKHILTREDLNTDTPYNTYTRTGLTPTPICNPGAVSMNAIMNPQTNSYYYYIHDKQGLAHYAIDLQGQADNIKKYLQ
jgi:UPF0755 protein